MVRLSQLSVSRRTIGGPLALRVWAVLLLAIYWGYGSYRDNFGGDGWPLEFDPGPNMGANFRTYRHASDLALAGEPFYGVAPPGLQDWAVYLYAPITVIPYTPFTLVRWEVGYAILVLANLLAGLVSAWMVVGFIEADGPCLGWIDLTVIGGIFLLSPFTFGTIYYGNINLLLALALVVGFLHLGCRWESMAGLAFGLAALWKVFPALVGVWLLQRRAYRAIGASVAVGSGGLLAGLLLFGRQRTQQYFLDVLLGRTETARFVGGYPADGTYYVTLQRPISQLLWTVWPGAPGELLLPLTAAVAAMILWPFYRSIETEMDHLLAIFATVIVVVTVFPALQWYLVLLFFPMIPLMYLWDGPGRNVFLVGAFLLFYNTRPGDLVRWVRDGPVPTVVEPMLVDVFTLATVQLYALAIMLAAGWWARRHGRHSTGQAVREPFRMTGRRGS